MTKERSPFWTMCPPGPGWAAEAGLVALAAGAVEGEAAGAVAGEADGAVVGDAAGAVVGAVVGAALSSAFARITSGPDPSSTTAATHTTRRLRNSPNPIHVLLKVIPRPA